jgi:hypothetical protein
MNDVELEQRPKKKRRFFVDDDPPLSSPASSVPATNELEMVSTGLATAAKTLDSVLDVDALAAVLGERLPRPVVAILSKLSENNLERGI